MACQAAYENGGAWLDFRDYGYDSKTLQDKMLHGAKLWLDEGVMFGEEGTGFMRINIASPRKRCS